MDSANYVFKPRPPKNITCIAQVIILSDTLWESTCTSLLFNYTFTGRKILLIKWAAITTLHHVLQTNETTVEPPGCDHLS